MKRPSGVPLAAAVATAATAISALILWSGTSVSQTMEQRLAYAEQTSFTRYADVTVTPSRHPLPEVHDEAEALEAMIEHHQDAIDAATRYLAANPSSTPEHRAFAERIVRVQTAQRDQMTTWREAWYPNASRSSKSLWSPMFCTIDSVGTDEAFWTTMTDHHRAAIAMYVNWVKDGTVRHLELGLLAHAVAKGQTGEIAAMNAWLAGTNV